MRNNMKAFVRLSYKGQVVPGSLVLRKKMPKNGRWKQITFDYCCDPTTTTTTTSTSTSSTTTTTTTM